MNSATEHMKDYESALLYFGARYYDSELTTMWLSVDPMADKYPEITPYHYCHWNPIKLVDQDGMFDASIHWSIVNSIAKDKGMRSVPRMLLAYGASYHSDIPLFWAKSIHIDSKHDANKIASIYNKARNRYEKNNKRFLFISAGRNLHTIADFYSHSNYIELYAEFAQKNDGYSMDLDKIPTFAEAQKDKKLWNFLKDNLRTGDFPNKKNNEYSHDEINKDNDNTKNGANCFGDTEFKLFEAAKAVAEKDIKQIVNCE